MENGGLLNARKPEELEADQSVWKIIVLAIIGLALAFFCGYFLRSFIVQGQLNFLLFCFLTGIGFLIVFLLEVFFIKTFWLANLIVFFETLAFLSPFYDRISQTFLLGALAGFLILIWGIYSGRVEISDMLKIKFWHVSSRALPKAITALALLISIISVGFFSLEENNFFISQSTLEAIISPIVKLGIVQNFLPGFDLSLSVDALVKNVATGQIEGNPQLKILPQNAKNQLIDQTIKDSENKISDYIGISLNPQIKASQAVYEIMVTKVSQLPANVKSFIPIGIAILIFLSIVSLSWPIRMIITIPAYLIYEICLALGFSTIMTEGRSGEIIILK